MYFFLPISFGQNNKKIFKAEIFVGLTYNSVRQTQIHLRQPI